MENRKPIKRDKALVPLSRDHHDGLLLCWKIRFGIKNNIPPERILKYVTWFWLTYLINHFRLEEEYVFTLLPETDEHRVEAQAQHNDLRRLVAYLSSETYTGLDVLATKLEEHIRFEERVLFEQIEKVHDPGILEELEEKILSKHRTGNEEWKDNFWLKNVQHVL